MRRDVPFLLALAAFVGLAMPLSAATTVTRDGGRYVIDNSTAADARKKIEAAGYTQVRDLRKSLDNFWHGDARKDGSEVHVVLAPDGKVVTEAD
jgi:hypothetical protein